MNNQTLQWTSRGSGQCPVCQSQYSNAWKPENCANCGHHIGGTYVPRKKRPKLSNPDCVQLAWQGVQHLFSVRTSPRGDRCFVLTDESVKFCHHEKCKGARAVTVGSPDASVRDFTCEHIDKTTGSTNQPEQQWVLNDSLLVQYPGDQSIKETLRQEVLQKLHGSPAVFKVASNMFVAFGPPSASSPLGYVHVSKKDNVLHCTSKHCRPLVNVSMGKQHKVKKLRIHQHLIFCLCRHLFAESLPASSSPTTELPAAVCNSCPPPSAVLPASSSMAAEAALQSTSTSSTSSQGSYVSSSVQSSGSEQSLMQSSTIRANITRSLPYKIPVEILQRANEKDAATVLNLTEGKWPNVFSPEETSCSLCESKLSEPRIHPGSDGKSYILTNANPFRACKILVKICPNKTCKAMHQVWPYDKGLFNLCDKFLVAFCVLLEWREAFKRGVPISVAIGSKLDTWCKQIPKDKCPTPSELRYASRLLYNGFYSFEIITLRSLDNAICGICGTIGEFYLGDGNEKNCCTLKGVRHEKSDSGSPCTLEVFLAKLKQTWIHRMLFSNDDGMDETIIAGEVPPIIAPYLRGQSVQNTEMEKRSIYLSSKKKDASGDPALLHRIIIDEKFSMENLETCELAALKQTAERCKIPVPSGASKSFVIGQLRALYATLLVGSSPCHGFDSLSGHTGGFYHIVCRHGCTVASKFLLLQESVRDAADLYLSLRYPPPVFICDTPCTFTKHMDVRCPDVSGLLWGDNSGCFEKPVIGRKPIQQSVPEIVPLEYRSHDKVLLHPEDLAEFQHPVSGVKQRYVLGDRFHTATEPHKSPLCGYHDIRLCAQSLSIKTSFQESENHRKNFRRLRSSTMQSFPVHFLYNYLMDFYHNEQIVDRQVQEMRRVTKEGQAVSRDQYHRLVITGPK